MTKTPNLKYDPPIHDPREEGLQHWDTLRQELMTTRDALGFAEIDLKVAREQVAKLEAENAKLSAAREQDRTEVITLRTQLQEGARFFINILKDGAASRAGAAAYAPKMPHEKVIDSRVAEIEEVLSGAPPKFLTSQDGEGNTDQQSMQ